MTNCHSEEIMLDSKWKRKDNVPPDLFIVTEVGADDGHDCCVTVNGAGMFCWHGPLNKFLSEFVKEEKL